MSSEAIVRLEDLWVGFRRGGGIHYVFRGAKLEVRRGELVCLVGPSGTGKSVLLNLLIGSLRRDAEGLVLKGSMEILGAGIDKKYPSRLLKRLGIVFQESALFEDLSTRRNASFGLRGRNLGRDEIDARVDRLLDAVQLADPPRRISELSGGQKKRLALARTLAKEPEFLIFDEPTSGLDPRLCRQIAALIQRTHEAGGGERTTLVVTHDYEAMVPMADRTYLLDPGEGAIKEIERKEELGAMLDALPMTGRAMLEPDRMGRLVFTLQRAAATPLRWLGPVARFLLRPCPSSFRQVLLRFLDSLVLPSLYISAAGALIGGLGTFFALENNPLKGAMDRQALIGLGKVHMAIIVPLIGSILFAARVGAGTSARLGNIRLGRQDDALRMLGADPGAYLITPIFWSCLIGLPLLTAPVLAASALSSLCCTLAARPLTPFAWASAFFQEVTFEDFVFGLVKMIGSGGLVAAVSAYLGLKPKGGAEDLGRDVTSAIVAATFLVILWHGIWIFIQYGP